VGNYLTYYDNNEIIVLIKITAMNIPFILLIGAFIIVFAFCGTAAKDVLGSK